MWEMYQKRATVHVVAVVLVSCMSRATTAATSHSHRDSGSADDWHSIHDLPHHQLRVFQFLTSGLTELVWNNGSIRNHGTANRLSNGCRDDMVRIEAGMDHGSKWAFEFPDASSKTPAGLMHGTLTSFGDYDQCLAIRHESMAGKYCGFELKYDSKNDASLQVDEILSRSVPSFSTVHLNMALCVPDTCSPADVRSLISMKLHSFPFRLVGDVTCVTAETTTWTSVVSDMRGEQIVAAAVIACVAAVVAVGSAVHVIDAVTRLLVNKSVRDYVIVPQVTDFLMHFSMGRSTLSLVTVRREYRFVTFPGLMVIVLAFAGVWLQTIFMFESIPVGLNVVHRSHDVKNLMSSFMTRPFLSDGLYGALSFYSGFLTLQFLKNQNTLNPLPAIVRKYTGLVFAGIVVICMDFLWPIFSQGPFYRRVSQQLLDKCSKTWYTHVTMTANLHTIQDLCAPHLTIGSIQFQLLVIGLIFSLLMLKLPRIGLRVVVIGSVIAILNVYASTYRLRSPVLFDRDFDLSASLEYVSHVMFSFSSQSVNYLLGLLSAFAMSSSSSQRTPVSRLEVAVGVLLFSFSLTVGGTHTALPFIRNFSVPIVIILTKLTSCSGLALMTKGWQSSCDAHDLEEDKERTSGPVEGTDVGDQESVVPEAYVVSFRKAFVRLCFTMFLVSPFVIRLDYFSSRMLFPVFLYDTVKRVCYSGFWSFWIGFFVYVSFVAPVKSLNFAALSSPVLRQELKAKKD